LFSIFFERFLAGGVNVVEPDMTSELLRFVGKVGV